jgi:hypothetical protein
MKKYERSLEQIWKDNNKEYIEWLKSIEEELGRGLTEGESLLLFLEDLTVPRRQREEIKEEFLKND